MGRFDNYSADEKKRIVAIASRLIEGQIEHGLIACTKEAIDAAMPEAIETARQTVVAVDEFLCG